MGQGRFHRPYRAHDVDFRSPGAILLRRAIRQVRSRWAPECRCPPSPLRRGRSRPSGLRHPPRRALPRSRAHRAAIPERPLHRRRARRTLLWRLPPPAARRSPVRSLGCRRLRLPLFSKSQIHCAALLLTLSSVRSRSYSAFSAPGLRIGAHSSHVPSDSRWQGTEVIPYFGKHEAEQRRAAPGGCGVSAANHAPPSAVDAEGAPGLDSAECTGERSLPHPDDDLAAVGADGLGR